MSKCSKLIVIIILLSILTGCFSLHYMNEKGIKADADDVRTKVGNIKEGNAYFWSRFELWIPFRPKDMK